MPSYFCALPYFAGHRESRNTIVGTGFRCACASLLAQRSRGPRLLFDDSTENCLDREPANDRLTYGFRAKANPARTPPPDGTSSNSLDQRKKPTAFGRPNLPVRGQYPPKVCRCCTFLFHSASSNVIGRRGEGPLFASGAGAIFKVCKAAVTQASSKLGAEIARI
jgi:hypothetical protein